MVKILGMVLAGFLALVADSQSLQAQTSYDPIYYCGVVGDPVSTYLRTIEGTSLTFPNEKVSEVSAGQSSTAYYQADPVVTAGYCDVLSFYYSVSQTAPTVSVYPVGYGVNGVPSGAGELWLITFATAQSRDGFLYYRQQREAASNVIDFDYYTALSQYEYWVGQEVEYLALYSLYTGMAFYYRDTTLDPKVAQFYLYYYQGLAGYYWYAGQGYQENADVVWAYCYQLALEALQ